jgi:type VI secretion system secreted protein VgrG
MASATESPANVADFRLHLVGWASGDFRITALEGTEGLSELFEYRLQFSSVHRDLDPQQFLGQHIELEFRPVRTVRGIVRRFQRVRDGSNVTFYELDIVPPHWLLTKRVQSRVFNEKRHGTTDVVSLVQRVLADAGLSDFVRPATVPKYETREFTVQYRESDWDFVSRLLEDEGIYHYFEHGSHPEDRCRMVLVDSKDVHSVFADDRFRVPYREPTNLVAESEFVYMASRQGAIQFGATSLDDFDFRKPGHELRVDRINGRFTGLGLADYPGGYTEATRGRRRVQTRLEEQQSDAEVFTFRATVRGFWAGSRFTLTDHPDERFNRDYLITRVTHRATQAPSAEEEVSGGAGSRYEAEVRAIPAEVQFRPPRVTRRPTVLGSQTAIVVGPPGEEIHTDEYGRIEVRFHWDQEGQHDVGASCWIRVSQGWAGGQYGMMFLPRVGQEVIVDFLEGDPDQPIITGRVYNRDHMPPYKLPDKKTISAIRTCSSPGAGGGNEIRFDDAKGHEQLLLFAQNSIHLRARGSRFESVCGDAHETVAGDQFELVKKNKHATVNLDLIEAVKGSKHLDVKGDVIESVEGRQFTYVDKHYDIANGGGVCIESFDSITLLCKGNFIKIDASGVTIVGKMVNINSGGAALQPVPYFTETAKEPLPAAATEFGRNVRYTNEAKQLDAVATGDGSASRGESQEETLTSWIEIELIDELGRPVPSERYEIKLPDGMIRRGTLDRRGMAHVLLPNPELCEITFPRLDAAAWERIA